MLDVLEAGMGQDKRQVSINMSAIPVGGLGGLGLVAMAAVVSVFFPPIGWMMAVSVTGGILLGLILVALGRVLRGNGPSGDDPTILFRELRDERTNGAKSSPVPERVGPDGPLEPRYSTL